MLKLDNISMTVNDSNGGTREIIRNINAEFHPGKIYAITGPNGGGKTTIAKVIMGIYRNCAGNIYLNGEDITELSVTERAKRGIAYAFQQPPRFKGLNVKDLLQIARPSIDDKSLWKNLRDVGLCPEDYLDRDVGPGLSGGEIKRIEIAQVLSRNTVVSIFDEPEAGVDLWTVQRLIGIIMSKYKNNPHATAIIITHNENVLPVCDEILVVNDGMIQTRGTADEIWPLIKGDIECKMKDQCRGEMGYEN
ncbi:MAG: ATP-binding cassette domain-containing protein [Syntrophomonadaceae bacterium]|nr:ATP-binding cassette domain-containing protein [Syntrophomonadaceae bacterium]MDD3888432.1 ATP-binding cassette domain-containing protein [Syntrophomonadaceae bacterium]MDD4549184.1 ATP-binding cassette domain-containing protein [Syntrophomonadaceae bacterium]